jgi:hypothetical protein
MFESCRAHHHSNSFGKLRARSSVPSRHRASPIVNLRVAPRVAARVVLHPFSELAGSASISAFFWERPQGRIAYTVAHQTQSSA